MKTEFKPIAMRCNKQQFNELKPRLDKYGFIFQYDIFDLKYRDDSFLTNNYDGNNLIGFTLISSKRETYETFNADLFLQCCGVELEETFTLTKSEIIENKDKTLKEMFKDVFEVELEVCKWYKHKGLEYIFCFNGCYEDCSQYGITKNGWNNEISSDKRHLHNFISATEEEVKTALVNEAIKRGFKEGVLIDKLLKNNCGTCKQPYKTKQVSNEDFQFDFDINYLFIGNLLVFAEGKWVTIIKQKEMTVAEIEKELGYNIKIIK